MDDFQSFYDLLQDRLVQLVMLADRVDPTALAEALRDAARRHAAVERQSACLVDRWGASQPPPSCPPATLRSFRIVEGKPLPTSFGDDVFMTIFGQPLSDAEAAMGRAAAPMRADHHRTDKSDNKTSHADSDTAADQLNNAPEHKLCSSS